MKKLLFIITALVFAFNANAQKWDFTSVSATDQANLSEDVANWTYDSSNNRYKNLTTTSVDFLKAKGVELEFTKGLYFTTPSEDAVRVDIKGKRLGMNKANTVITIKDMKAGNTITVNGKSSSSSTARGLNVENITPVSGSFNATSTDEQTNVGTVTADGDITLTCTGGYYVYSIVITDVTGGGDDGGNTGGNTGEVTTKYSVEQDLTKNQMRITLNSNDLLYYNTGDLKSVDLSDNAISVNPLAAEDADVFTGTIANIGFSKVAEGGQTGDIINNGVEITEAKGWLESAFVTWKLYDGATSYAVYIKGGNITNYTKLDKELVRNYGTYGRADMVGLLPSSDYAMKVVPIIGGAEDASKASEAKELVVMNYQRDGFAHYNYPGVGAYNDNGTLKAGGKILYVTAASAKTVSTDVIINSKGGTQTCTGLQSIIDAYQKGYDTTPLAIRLIGTISATDLDHMSSSAEGLQVKGKNAYSELNITIEGIGEDATITGFGILARNAKSLELRNFAVMLCKDDCVSLDTDNSNVWVHHLDLFYGNAGSDSDQAKGDGTIDIKSDSKYISVSYNHFFDSGKSSLCGMTSESGPNYIEYNHNWFDHSDSRHPRVRTMTVHVWNNYYDGCAKYGVGATMGSSVFVERNYFRDTKDPMMISLQGTDAKGDGTFSGEEGGMIKSFANVYAEKGSSSNFTPITHKDNATSFDCYEAATRDEQVPASYVALVGGTTYNNFDTNSTLMYSYTPDEAAEVPAKVTGYFGAGRLNKGDLKYTFSKSVDSNYSVDTTLKSALQSYKTSLVGIFGE